MPWTAEDLANIDAAIASGELEVQHSDGRRIKYRTMEELKLAREIIAPTVPSEDPTTPGVPGRRRYVEGASGW